MSHWPKAGSGAAIVRDGRILLLKRVKTPEAGCWSLPGGKIDEGEPYETAIYREVEEELGIRLTDTQLLCVVNLIGAKIRNLHIPQTAADVCRVLTSAHQSLCLGDIARGPKNAATARNDR